ncbi:MAG: hypothetical protein WC389_07970 [Lutibacter sp.]|jgi:hypothetical protein
MGKIQDLFGNEVVGCQCPDEIKNGLDGMEHICPQECVETPEEIVKACVQHLKEIRRRMMLVSQLKEKYINKLKK